MTLALLKIQIGQIVRDTLGEEQDLTRFSVSLSVEPKFGDYSTNAALVFAKMLKRPTRDIAQELASAMTASSMEIEKVEVAGPGFINFSLTDDALIKAAKDSATWRPQTYYNQIVVSEYSDPNPFKPLHAGHLYTTLVGDSISRLVERAGGKVVRISYGGDVGLHVARCMWAIIRDLGGEKPNKLDGVAKENRNAWLGERYVDGTTAYENDDNAKQEIILVNKRVYELHETNDHDSDFARIYWITRQWSYDYFPQLYELLQVTPFDRTIPESEVTPLGLKMVREQTKRGVYELSKGATIFKGEPFGLHTRVFINSQGLPTYEAKDVGLLLTKWRDYKFDLSIYITSNEQEQYMAVMFKSVEQFEPQPVARSRHITHGVVKLAGGMKMSSRKGNVVGAIDVLRVAGEAAAKLQNKPNEETVLAAVKYAFLKSRIGGDIVYDPIDSVSLEGNSGPYLQYAHARARSIITKANSPKSHTLGSFDLSERILALKLAEYAEVLDRAVMELLPHHIATYLYELAQTFNRFYEGSKVIGDLRQEQRLRFTRNYRPRSVIENINFGMFRA
jgi:arginyl-tRNA synthetase